ncbi:MULTISPECIES: thiol peroxidase [Nonlabens]|uniref:Thiol peroxidase n=2 Tax=Nonlabens ulvanivorans TaxID=906888 RepID=A0A081DE74_NONUL|nr:thiol peroxidase [Nonlabens ulvanivorans]GAK77220.1 thiol peroxidase, Tpx-type [Nonlabens ulvanivorans]GAK91078.1 thiol peroxidase [Nonlabens ulvanivorans]GAK94335.1 thiol peroxidase [Nonlabens ulvanivorans]GAK99741.1 thiol peroxidase [Nonlabens ulvanivorans]
MATITIGGNEISTSGTLPEVGSQAPDFKLKKADLSEASLNDYKGKRVILNIFPSVDTDVCATSVKNFNKRATELDNTAVLCISRDTPFAQKRFASDEGLENVVNLSDVIDGSFGKDYGLTMTSGPLAGFHSRAVVVLNEEGKVIYNEQVPEIADEPNYLAALKTLL